MAVKKPITPAPFPQSTNAAEHRMGIPYDPMPTNVAAPTALPPPPPAPSYQDYSPVGGINLLDLWDRLKPSTTECVCWFRSQLIC